MSEVVEQHFKLRERPETLAYMRRESLLNPGESMEPGIEYPGGQDWNDAVINYGEPEGCDQFRYDKEWVRYRGPAWWAPEDENNVYYDSAERWWETASDWAPLLVKEDSWDSISWFRIRVGFINPAQILLRVMDHVWDNLIGPAGSSASSLLINPGQIYQVRTDATTFIGLLFETNNAIITDIEFSYYPPGP